MSGVPNRECCARGINDLALDACPHSLENYERISRRFGLRILTAGGTASRLQRPAGVRTDSLGPPKLVTVKGKVATLACGQASKQAWPNSSRYKRRGQCRSRMRRADPSARQTRQPDHSAKHSAHAVGHAHCTATRIKASVDDLPHRFGNGAQRIFDVGVIQALTAGGIPQ